MSLIDNLELAINFNSDVLDKSGNNRDGTVNGMTYDTTTPILGDGTGVFNGIDNDVEIDVSGPKSDILDLTTGTIAFWVRFPTIAEYKRLFTITHAGQAYPDCDEWGIAFRGDTTNQVQAYCINNRGVIMSAYTPDNSINDNNKHLIIVRADWAGDIEILIDDVSQSLTGSISDKFFGHAVDADTMRIGSLERDTILYGGDKDIDALAIWSEAKPDAELTQYWNSGDGVELSAIEPEYEFAYMVDVAGSSPDFSNTEMSSPKLNSVILVQ